MDTKLRINEIKAIYKDKTITSKELFDFYCEKEKSLKQSTFRWRVYDLKQKGILINIGKGLYSLNANVFKPHLNLELKEIFNQIKFKYKYIDLCIWETRWLNEFMIHQSFTNKIILEVSKEALLPVYHYLKELNYDVSIYSKTNNSENLYSQIILKKITSTSPLMIIDDTKVPKIEKILVDIFFESELYVAFQGVELINIFKEIFEKYNVNISTLKQYARKRHIKDNIMEFISKNLSL